MASGYAIPYGIATIPTKMTSPWNILPIEHLMTILLPMDAHNDSDNLIAAVANMLKARFSLKQIAASLGISIREAMRLIGKAGQVKM